MITVGIWQDNGITGSVERNLVIIGTAAEQAREKNVEVLVFPECFLTGYYQAPERVRTVAGEVTDDVLGAIAEVARRTGVALVVGSYEKSPEGIFNAAHFFAPGASRPITYRKRALYGDWEKSVFKRGNGPVLFDYKGIRFGILICFDIEFPELLRETALQHAEIALVPTALMAPHDNVPKLMIPTRAIENGIHVVYANRVGEEGELSFVGLSCIAGPFGPIAAAGQGAELLVESIGGDCGHDAIDYLQALPEIHTQG
ncbi:nitrilase-related carbon-nitrogen hydrolase [Acidihalobacter prosperus]|uniref:5-aminopentanamidase n=1 Tax=Acidihalobacter prosperus TaxID=160660 RepID=A0A1A6C4V5_9GAMM|nr:nitrilase-related carbon-nitrogen hydrolase [Acidihalobacter prosperus]OBS09601.1 5-aminopentanamidase [Acidihalobacter prosperus]